MIKKWISFFSIIVLVISLSIAIFGNRKNSNQDLAFEIPPIPEKTVELVTLYFPDRGKQYLVRESRVIEHTTEQREKLVLEELIKGPEDLEKGTVIPPATKLYSVTTKNGTAYVNLSSEFKTDLPVGNNNEILAVYSIVNSLTNLKGINKVQIRIEGYKDGFLQKYMPLDYVYKQNLKLINEPILTPIEVVKSYFNLIEREEYRKAFDLLYNPANVNIDYSMYYRYQKEKAVMEYNIYSYEMFEEDDTFVVIFDYLERTRNGDEFHYNNREFRLKNYHGEWKIVINSLPKYFHNNKLQ